MNLLFKGKTKNVYELANGQYRLQFKDDVTGADGVFDPGANQVGLTIDGIGKEDLKLSAFFFEKINAAGFPTHFITFDAEAGTMDVKPAFVYGKGLELICRFVATGSFIRRYGAYAKDGDLLNGYVEVTLKDDERGDPLITVDALEQLNILNAEEYAVLVKNTRDIASLIKAILAEKELDLYDIKLEFGKNKETGEIMLIDEISGGNMRVYKKGLYVQPLDLSRYMLNG